MIGSQTIQEKRNEIVEGIATLISQLEGLRKVDGKMPVWVESRENSFEVLNAYVSSVEGSEHFTLQVDVINGCGGYLETRGTE